MDAFGRFEMRSFSLDVDFDVFESKTRFENTLFEKIVFPPLLIAKPSSTLVQHKQISICGLDGNSKVYI